MLMTEKKDDWHKPFLAFLLDQRVPEDKAEHERMSVSDDEVATTS
jgi:hypothetical protein